MRVDGRARARDLPPGNRPAGWWNYTGLVREVYLEAVPAIEIRNPVVTTRLSPGRTRVDVRAQLRNNGRAATPLVFGPLELTAPDGGPSRAVATLRSGRDRLDPGATTRVRASFTIRRPLLWSPQRPSLYAVTMSVPRGMSQVVHFGVREWRRTAGGRVLLNGRPIALRGVSFHEQAPGRGSALTPYDRAQLVNQIAALGADFARAHYPPHPALLDAFDRLGIVYWDEVPVWRLRGAQLHDLDREGLRMLRRMIERDRNHASVMVWGAENETLRGGQAEVDYLRASRRLTHSLDPTRLLGAEAALSPVAQLSPALRIVDALGFNEYLGWYSGKVDDVFKDYREARSRFPRQAPFVTEVGAEANRPGRANEKGTYAFESAFLARQLAALARLPGLNGTLVWLLRDFVARPGWGGGNPRPSPPVSAKGLLRVDGTRKPAFDVVRRAFGPRRAQPGSSR